MDMSTQIQENGGGRRSSNVSQSGGTQSRSSSMQKIVGPERKKYTSLFILTESNPLRRGCRLISESKVSFLLQQQVELIDSF